MNARRLATSLAHVAALPAATLLVAALLAAPAHAQFTQVVTQPTGASTAPDAFPGPDVWYRDDVRTGSSAGITTDYARSGIGSMLLTGTGSASKANVAMYFNQFELPFTRLFNIPFFGYEYYRDASSTAAAHLAPAMRLLVDADGDLSTADDRGSLVYEPVYNEYPSGVPVDSWVPVTVGASTNLWFFQSGVGVETVYDRTLADYQAGTYTSSAGFAHITGNSLVYGMNFGTGSGWSGTFTGAVDNVTIAFDVVPIPNAPTPSSFTYNFEPEVTATPEPASLALLGTGLLALGGTLRARRRA